MLSWLPIIGPLIDGVTRIFTGFTDRDIARTKAQVEENKTTASLTESFRDDIGVRLSRDIVMFPVVAWTGLTVWDSIVVHKFPNLVWETGPILQGSGLTFLPYAVLTFLFGLNVMQFLKR